MDSNFVKLFNKIHLMGLGRGLLSLIIAFSAVYVLFSIFDKYKLCAAPVVLLAGIVIVGYTTSKMEDDVRKADQLYPGFQEYFNEQRNNKYKQSFGCLGIIFSALFGLIIPAASQGIDDTNQQNHGDH